MQKGLLFSNFGVYLDLWTSRKMSVTVIAFQFYSESPRKSRGFLARLIALKDYCSHDGPIMGSRSRQTAVRARAIVSREHRHNSPRQTINDLSKSLGSTTKPWLTSQRAAENKMHHQHIICLIQGNWAYWIPTLNLLLTLKNPDSKYVHNYTEECRSV